MTEEHARKLELEMVEAAEASKEHIGAENNPFLVILWRLNHQDGLLERLTGDMSHLSSKVDTHIAASIDTNDAVNDLVLLWRGSKLAGRIGLWVVSILSAVAGAYLSAKKGFFS